MRDSQRQKLYDAEDATFGTQPTITLEEAQALVDAICASALVQERYPRAKMPPTVIKAHGRRRGGCYSAVGMRIELSEWAQQKWIVLHELAHHFVRPHSSRVTINGVRPERDITPHGREYAECYLWLVRCYLGKGVAEKLEAQFKAHRVAFKPKRGYTISDAERERRRERASRLAAERW